MALKLASKGISGFGYVTFLSTTSKLIVDRKILKLSENSCCHISLTKLGP